jgi:hypothetical protein
MENCLDILENDFHHRHYLQRTGNQSAPGVVPRCLTAEAPTHRSLEPDTVAGELRHFIDTYVRSNVEIVTSSSLQRRMAPTNRVANVRLRPLSMSLENSTKGLRQEDSGLVLNLVHHPTGFYLPGSQSAATREYKSSLLKDHGVHFNDLFCITNMPVGRFQSIF